MKMTKKFHDDELFLQKSVLCQKRINLINRKDKLLLERLSVKGIVPEEYRWNWAIVKQLNKMIKDH